MASFASRVSSPSHMMWDGELSRLAKEAIAVSVAQTNACHY